MNPIHTDHAFATRGPYGTLQEPTYSGALSLLRRPYSKDPADADVAILGVPFDLAVTNRPGTRLGPRAVRAASTLLSWRGAAWRWDFDPFERLNVVDTGDCYFDWGMPENVAAEIEAEATRILDADAKLLSIGGDHFISYPLLKAHAAKHGSLALVQFDSHSDTWREEGKRIDHGTMFFHAVQEGVIDPSRSVQLGIRSANSETHGIEILDADAVIDRKPKEIADRIRERVGAGPAYLTFDIDFFDPAHAPGTGTPVCGGPSFNRGERILCALTGIDFVGMDIVEVSPAYDTGEITALAAATVALNMLCVWAAAAAP